MKDRYASFCQSTLDFPCSVELGKNTPSFGINRWGNHALRFVPPDDEGFSVRGDKRQLLYKGRRRSHRITVHSDTSFEYDCILFKEPDSNTVSLRMEGAENFDFFRQPDFVRDPFLKGSYAVYKKETLIGQGTGKLCHIHRPLIIDALGRRCWGALAIIGNELRITIPEKWLAEAKYPVTVDPTVGTTQIGSQWQYYNDDYDPDWDEEEDMWLQEFFEGSTPVNKFLIPENINGSCKAFFYTLKGWETRECGGRPVFYSDDNNMPSLRRSKQENFIDFTINTSNPIGWRSGTFETNQNIQAGSNIWFGCFVEFFWFFRFDYGSRCYNSYWYLHGDSILEKYPLSSYFRDFKISMYFTYTANYTRTLIQGVNLTDNRNLKIDFKRTTTQEIKLSDVRNLKIDFLRKEEETSNISETQNTKIDFLRKNEQIVSLSDINNKKGVYKRINAMSTNVNDIQNRIAYYKREKTDDVNGTTAVSVLFSFFRNCFDSIGNTDNLFRFPSFFRNVNDDVNNNTFNFEQRELNRICDDTAVVDDRQNKKQGFFRKVLDDIDNTDNNSFSVLFVRSVQDTQTMSDKFQQVRNFIRCLYVEAANIAETNRSGEFYRTESDTADADGSLFRQLSIFIKLVSSCFVRDFIIRRFLIAREELVLKSKITLELSMESKIN